MRLTAAHSRLVLPAALLSALAAFSSATAAAEEPALQGLLSGRVEFQKAAEPAKLDVSAKLVAEKLAPGETATLLVTVTLPEGYYIYSTNPSFGGATKIALDKAAEGPGLAPIDEGFRADREPKATFEPLLEKEVEKFTAEVTWFRRYRIAEGADASKLSVSGSLSGQYCSSGPAGQCIPIRPARKFTATLAEGKTPEYAVDEPGKEAGHPFAFEERPTQSDKPMPAVVFARLAPENAKPGETVTLEVGLRIDEPWHTYSLTQKLGQSALPTELQIVSPGLKPLDDTFAVRPAPEIKHVPLKEGALELEEHHDEVVWSRKFAVLPAAAPARVGVAGKILFQLCKEGACLPPKAVSFSLGHVSEEDLAGLAEMTSTSSPAAGIEATSIEEGTDPTPKGLLPFLITAVLAGFAALLTPCVFPMVPITVSIFLKESEKEHHRPFWMASIYCGGIIMTFTVLGVLIAAVYGATQISQFANVPWLNLGIAGMLVFFGLNLLGMFEIRVPGGLLTWTSGKKGQGGAIGVLFMALTFTLVTFTCTFAFVGGLLVWAARGEYYWPIVGMAGFSAAFSLPFFFLALFPTLLQKLPKSGGWMNTVKVTMGMIEVGAALKFFSIADFAVNPVAMVFDYTFVMVGWITIAACTGLYLLGLFRLPHDTPVESVSVPRLGIAVLFLSLAGFLSVGLFGAHKPAGKLWEQIAAIAPPIFEGGDESDLGPYLEHDGLKYALDYEQAVAHARGKNAPLLLDFTGVNCPNCRLMEDRMTRPHNRELLENFVRVRLYTDNVPFMADRLRAEELLEINRRVQELWFGNVTLPAYAVVTPDGKIVLSAFKNMETRDGEFAAFMDRGLQEWGKLVAGGKGGAPRVAQQSPAARIAGDSSGGETVARGGSGE